MSPLMLTLVAAVETYDFAREYVDRLSRVSYEVLVLLDCGRGRCATSLTKLENMVAVWSSSCLCDWRRLCPECSSDVSLAVQFLAPALWTEAVVRRLG